MGPQSQRRNTLAKRTAKLKGSAGFINKKKRLGLSVYSYHSEDYEQLLAALKDGSMTGEKVTSGEIKQMQKGKTFRQRYNQYLRKVIKPAETMRQCLDDWFCSYKVTASEGRPDPGGRLDPKTQQPLFTAETKEAVDNCKKNAEVIGDPLPIEKMYHEVKATQGHSINCPLGLVGDRSQNWNPSMIASPILVTAGWEVLCVTALTCAVLPATI
ncbi:hypothetical protein IV203_022147 [Nitzschia inconspicua]|uniref:Uncharacterized protein n=1 Tax=Nitzschia inconspicua TaxID=303405 RepID=A0A9K3KJI2_9STRA|nr:hypothetical protein IV203_022147 [Nitzschia inconspicua]